MNSRLGTAAETATADAPVHGQRRVAASAAALTGLCLALTACHSASAAGKDTDIEFWAFGREGEVLQTLMPEFQREHPGVHVRVQQIPWTAAHEKLLTAYVGNATPDLAQLGNTWIPEFVALNALLPLDSLDSSSPEVDESSFFPGIWRTNLVNGRLYGVPWYVDTRVLFYRKDLLAQVGYPQPPTTWAQWRDAMRAVKARGGSGRYAIFAPFNEWNVPVILGLQAGSPLLKDDGRYGGFGEPPFRRAFDFYLDWYHSGVAPVLGINDVGNIYQEFERGTFAMWITGPWNIGEFRRRLPREMQDKWGTAPLPGPDGPASGLSMAGGSSVVLFRRSHHHAEAWQLAEYLGRPEQQLRFYRLTGDLPARTEAWRDSALAGDPAAHAFWEQLQRVVPLPQVPEWELIATRVFDYAEQTVRGGMATDTALARLDREVDQILARRRWLLSRAPTP